MPVVQLEAAEANNDHNGNEKAVDAKPGTVEWTAPCMRTKWAEADGEEDDEAGVKGWTGVHPNEQDEANK
ncbi:hypothetical protein EST38_g12884 [Candolleomyces aberdarensis]|uniref:Uncharacterized protein n=1 Tax=Candolleomyces aberdarensis TaxID=2316362 RepID=A0A4V1Q1W1_9AGAR|nr:hypothetical protein EST38_g12884 [Candolleomyces aberdarensis]